LAVAQAKPSQSAAEIMLAMASLGATPIKRGRRKILSFVIL
jgi:hypothetical protein